MERSILHGKTRYLHTKTVAKRLGVSQASVQVACQNNLVGAVRVGGAWYVQESALRALVKAFQDRRAKKSIQTAMDRKKEFQAHQKQAKPKSYLKRVGIEITKRSAKN